MNGSFLFGVGASCVIVGLVTEVVELKYQLAETQRDLGAVRRLLLADEHPSSSGAGVVTVAAVKIILDVIFDAAIVAITATFFYACLYQQRAGDGR